MLLSMASDPWPRLWRRARQQLGLFTTEQAAHHGVSRTALVRAVAKGRISRVSDGVYDVAGSPDSRRKRMLAVQLAGAPLGVLSHTTAGWLHGLFDVVPIGIEILFPRRLDREIPGATVHTSQTLPPEDVVRDGPFRLTSVARTICDLAGILDDRSLRLVVFDAWRRGLVTPDEIGRCRERLGRVNGARRVRGVLALCVPEVGRGRSAWESEGVALLRAHGVPLGETNYPIYGEAGELLFELDLAYVTIKFAYELQSREYHSITPDRDRDEHKRKALAGWEIKPVPLAMVIQRPRDFVEMVRRDLRARGYPGA
jgi:hypothetical protein